MMTWEWEVCGVRVVGEAVVDVCWDKGTGLPVFLFCLGRNSRIERRVLRSDVKAQNLIHSSRQKKRFVIPHRGYNNKEVLSVL